MHFQRAYIEISNVCNLQCDFCPEVERPAQRMTPALFQRAIEESKGLVDEVTFHVMGEPLAHPEFETFVEMCAKKSVPVQLTTNGTLLDHGTNGGRSRADILLHPIFRQINFSLQSFPANIRQSLEKRNAGFDSYLQRIFRFTRIALDRRPDLYINFRIWNIGSDEASIEHNEQFLKPIREEFGFELASPVDVRKRKSYRVQGRLYVHFDSRFEWPNLERARIQTEGKCHALKTHFSILSDGTIVPCCLDKEAGIPLGRLQADSPSGELAKILANDRARRLRDGFDRGQLHEELCERCSFISRFQTGITV